MRHRLHDEQGFTLIELLVVIAIIGLLSSIVLASLRSVRSRSRDTTRLTQLEQFRTALELYYSDHAHYPKTFEPGQIYTTPYPGELIPNSKTGECFGDPSSDLSDLVPQYSSNFPHDPSLNCSGTTHSWVYASDGVDYKLITHIENAFDVDPKFHVVTDPVWDDGDDPCKLDGPDAYHVGYWTPGANCWSI